MQRIVEIGKNSYLSTTNQQLLISQEGEVVGPGRRAPQKSKIHMHGPFLTFFDKWKLICCKSAFFRIPLCTACENGIKKSRFLFFFKSKFQFRLPLSILTLEWVVLGATTQFFCKHIIITNIILYDQFSRVIKRNTKES